MYTAAITVRIMTMSTPAPMSRRRSGEDVSLSFELGSIAIRIQGADFESRAARLFGIEVERRDINF
jgi:hypothetical protein